MKFLITCLKDIEFRFFAHSFFKHSPNSKCFFFFFYIIFRKKIQKNYLKCFYMRFLSLNILILFLKLRVYSSIFLIIFYFKLQFILQIWRPGWAYDNYYFFRFLKISKKFYSILTIVKTTFCLLLSSLCLVNFELIFIHFYR